MLYYGGFDLLPRRGKVGDLRHALGLPADGQGGRKISTLSRGELQQMGLDLAFSLVSDALLLDEPWTALEPDAREELNEKLRLTVKQRVVICSSHDLDEVARVADDIVFLADGIGIWKCREDGWGSRDDLIRLYRQSKKE